MGHFSAASVRRVKVTSDGMSSPPDQFLACRWLFIQVELAVDDVIQLSKPRRRRHEGYCYRR